LFSSSRMRTSWSVRIELQVDHETVYFNGAPLPGTVPSRRPRRIRCSPTVGARPLEARGLGGDVPAHQQADHVRRSVRELRIATPPDCGRADDLIAIPAWIRAAARGASQRKVAMSREGSPTAYRYRRFRTWVSCDFYDEVAYDRGDPGTWRREGPRGQLTRRSSYRNSSAGSVYAWPLGRGLANPGVQYLC